MDTFNKGSQTVSYALGAFILILAVMAVSSGMSVSSMAHWALEMFGISFIALLALLVLTVIFCWFQMIRAAQSVSDRSIWTETGHHASNAVATLALTYTLLGISLGIGTLGDQELTPQTIQTVIRGLTEHFSLAFMTTVVGLPVSALLRALIAITDVHFTRHGGSAHSL